jgi:hypothetical protein
MADLSKLDTAIYTYFCPNKKTVEIEKMVEIEKREDSGNRGDKDGLFSLGQPEASLPY